MGGLQTVKYGLYLLRRLRDEKGIYIMNLRKYTLIVGYFLVIFTTIVVKRPDDYHLDATGKMTNITAHAGKG